MRNKEILLSRQREKPGRDREGEREKHTGEGRETQGVTETHTWRERDSGSDRDTERQEADTITTLMLQLDF